MHAVENEEKNNNCKARFDGNRSISIETVDKVVLMAAIA